MVHGGLFLMYLYFCVFVYGSCIGDSLVFALFSETHTGLDLER